MRNTILFSLLLLAGALSAQPCGFPVTINPIPPLCQYDGEYELMASPPGGEWSGPSVSPDGIIHLWDLQPGVYTVYYTYSNDTCNTTVSRNFSVGSTPQLQLAFPDTFDCADPQPVQLVVTTTGSQTQWNGPGGSGSFFGSQKTLTVSKAGEYFFRVTGGGASCPLSTSVELPQVNNNLVVNAQDCTPCNLLNIRICSDTIPPGGSAGWSMDNQDFGSLPSILVFRPGMWYLRVQDSVGCLSRDSIFVPFVRNSNPSVNAGSDFAITCNRVVHLNGATQQDSTIAVLWTTEDGNIIDPPNQWAPRINQPGTYIFRAYNSFTGCGSQDTCVVSPLLFTFPHDSISATICEGDTLLGYFKTGSYIDRFDIGTDCDSFRVLLLTVKLPDTTQVGATTCDPAQAGVTQTLLTNAGGCDSIVVTTTVLLPSDTTQLSATTCDPAQAGVTQTLLTNAGGCDSIVVTTTVLLPSPNTALTQTICAGETYEGYSDSGVYTDLFTAANGCDSTRVLDLTVLTPIQVDSVSVMPSSGDDGSIELVSVSGGQPPYTFAWSSGATGSLLSGLSPGAYTVTITDAEGCEQVDSAVVQMVVGWEQPQLSWSIRLQPHPARAGQPNPLQLEGLAGSTLNLQLWDSGGRAVYRLNFRVDSDRQTCLLPALAPGFYLLECQRNGSERLVFKVMVE